MSFAIKIGTKWIERHVPLSKLSFSRMPEDIEVEAVQANGHELQWLLDVFHNIPVGPAQVMKWTGETAQFIFDNLPYSVVPPINPPRPRPKLLPQGGKLELVKGRKAA